MPSRVLAQQARVHLGSPWLVIAWLLAVVGVRAHAAPPPIEITSIDWGFDGVLTAERWNPVTLWVQSRERPFSGLLTVTFSQDATQKAAISLPVATTPGTSTPVELCLAIPRLCRSIEFAFAGDRGRASWTAHETPRRPEDFTLPKAFGHSHTVVIVGNPAPRTAFDESDPADPTASSPAPTSLRMATTYTSQSLGGIVVQSSSGAPRPVPPSGEFPWSAWTPAVIQPQRLPRSWMAYDGADVVIISAELGIADGISLDPRSIDALRTWVASGGRLVLLAHEAGDGWTRWFPEAAGGLPITLGDRTKINIPPEALADDDKRASIATARPIRLTTIGAAHGWSLRWRLDESSALIAEGPAGFGWISVLSMSPAQAARSGEIIPRRQAWRNALQPTLNPILDRVRPDSSGNIMPWFDDWLGSAPDRETNKAQQAVLDLLVQVPPFAHTSFLVIAACMLLLALLLGPGDFLLLKFLRKRHLAWLSALVWVALASLLAGALPGMVRQTESRLDRFVMRDVLIPAHHDEPSIEVSTGITGLFAGRVARPRFPEVGVGSWWRGISPIAAIQRLGGQSALVCVQGAPDLTSARGTLPITTSLNQWTLRAYLDHAPAAPTDQAPTATLLSIQGQWDVTLVGLPPSAKILDARLRAHDGISEQWWELRPNDPTARYLRSSPDTPPTTLEQLPEWHVPNASDDTHPSWAQTGSSSHGLALRLPGVRDREHAIAARVASRRFACLYLRVQDLTPTLPIDGFPAHEQGILRILIPLQP